MSPRLRYAVAGAALVLVPMGFHAAELPAPTRAVQPPSRWCAAVRGGTLRAYACEGVDDPAWFAPQRVRDAVGAPLCWWRASPAELERVEGVGGALAARLAEFRDRGGAPTAEELDAIRGVGPRMAGAVEAAVTTRCSAVEAPP